jgi:hypothetical protein
VGHLIESFHSHGLAIVLVDALRNRNNNNDENINSELTLAQFFSHFFVGCFESS